MLAIEGGPEEAPTTLIPQDYQIIRSERVAGLNIRFSNYSTQLAEGKFRRFSDYRSNRSTNYDICQV